MTAARTASRTAALALAVLALAACAGSGTDVAGKSFTVVEVTGHDLVDASAPTLVFTDDSVGAQPGCNSMSAPATWDDGTLRLTGEMRSTMMACSTDLMDQDVWFSELLAGEPRLDLDDETLTVTGTDATVVLVQDA